MSGSHGELHLQFPGPGIPCHSRRSWFGQVLRPRFFGQIHRRRTQITTRIRDRNFPWHAVPQRGFELRNHVRSLAAHYFPAIGFSSLGIHIDGTGDDRDRIGFGHERAVRNVDLDVAIRILDLSNHGTNGAPPGSEKRLDRFLCLVVEGRHLEITLGRQPQTRSVIGVDHVGSRPGHRNQLHDVTIGHRRIRDESLHDLSSITSTARRSRPRTQRPHRILRCRAASDLPPGKSVSTASSASYIRSEIDALSPINCELMI